MLRTFSTSILALTAVLGLFANTGMASLLPAESMMEPDGGGMGSSKSSQRISFRESVSEFQVPCERIGADDCSDTGMQQTSSPSVSSVSPCTLSESVELRVVSLTTYEICESRAFYVVPFLDGIFRPPKSA